MKRPKFKIGNHLKGIMLAAALFGGTLAMPTAKAKMAFVPTIGLVAGMKKKGFELTDDEEKYLNQQEAILKSAFESMSEKHLSKEEAAEEFAKVLKDAPLSLKNMKVGDGELAKSAEEVLREMGSQITDMKKSMEKGDADKRTFKSMLDESMKDIKGVYDAKRGSFALTLKAAAIMTTDNTIDETANPDDLIESFSVAAFVAKRQDRRYVFDIADHTTVQEVSQFKTWLEEGDEQGAFAIVAEGAVKPLVSLALVRNHSEARKIAAKYVVTEEFTKWRKEAYTIIRRLIMDKLMRDYEDILTTGLLSSAATYAGTALADSIFQPNKYDAIGAVAAQIESLNFQPDTLILNPQDKWAMHLSKDDHGQYLSINVPSIDGETRLMSFKVRTSNKMPVGYFMLGEGGLWKVEDEAITVRMGYGIEVTKDGANVTAVSSDFDNNRFRVVVETFFHDYIATNHIGSFVYAQFSVVQAAIDATV